MSRRRTGRRDFPELAAERGPEDGNDPRAFHDRRADRPKGRKALQLCGQIRDALAGVLAGCSDRVLRDLTVVTVEPAPHAGRLLVTVAVPGPADATDRSTAAEHLVRAAGWLRTEMAAAIHRRKAPELVFAVI
jgi:ribosome-binding factor A